MAGIMFFLDYAAGKPGAGYSLLAEPLASLNVYR